MKIKQVVLVLSSILVIDAKITKAERNKIKTTDKAEKNTERIENVQSDVNSANMAGLMARVRRGGWDRN
jgi:hypothetical protein